MKMLAMSVSADFYPGLEDKPIDGYVGNSIEWTFALPRSAEVGAGIYELKFVHSLAEEERLGWPLFGGDRVRPDEDAA